MSHKELTRIIVCLSVFLGARPATSAPHIYYSQVLDYNTKVSSLWKVVSELELLTEGNVKSLLMVDRKVLYKLVTF